MELLTGQSPTVLNNERRSEAPRALKNDLAKSGEYSLKHLAARNEGNNHQMSLQNLPP